MARLLNCLVLFALIVVGPLAQASVTINVSDVNRLLSQGDFNSDSLNGLLFEELEGVLDDQNLVINNGVITATYKGEDTGRLDKANNGCSWHELRNIRGRANLKNTGKIVFDVNSLREVSSASVVLKGSMVLNAWGHVRKGLKAFMSCRTYWQLSGDLEAKTDFKVTVRGKVKFNPEDNKTSVVIDPELTLTGDIDFYNTKVDAKTDAKVANGLHNLGVEELIRNFVRDQKKQLEKDLNKELAKLQEDINRDLKPGPLKFDGLPGEVTRLVESDKLKELLFGAFSTDIPDEFFQEHYEELLTVLVTNDKEELNNLLAQGLLCEVMYKDVSTPLVSNNSGKSNGRFYSTSFPQYCKSKMNAEYGVNKPNKWTLYPEQTFNIGVLPLTGNTQPYMERRVYKTVDTPKGQCKLEMRVYKKDVNETGLKPLMMVHGGGWKDRHVGYTGMVSQASHYTDAGFVVFAPFYRLVGNSDPYTACNSVHHEEITQDVEDALQWVIDHGADYGAEASQVSLMGQSAGGHLVSWLATRDKFASVINKVIAYYPPVDFLHMAKAVKAILNREDSAVVEGYLGKEHLDAGVGLAMRYLNLSLNDVLANMQRPEITQNTFTDVIASNPWAYPSFFILQGLDDQLLPSIQSVRLCNALGGNPDSGAARNEVSPGQASTVYDCDGKGSQLHMLAGVGHTFDYCADGFKCEATEDRQKVAISKAVQRSIQWLNQEGDIPGAIVYKPQLDFVNPSLDSVDLQLKWSSDNSSACWLTLKDNGSVIATHSLAGTSGVDAFPLQASRFASDKTYQAELTCAGRAGNVSSEVNFSFKRTVDYTESGCNKVVDFANNRTHYYRKKRHYLNGTYYTSGSCARYQTLTHKVTGINSWQWSNSSKLKRQRTADIRTDRALEKNNFLYLRQTAVKTGHRTPYVKRNKRDCIVNYRITTEKFDALGKRVGLSHKHKSVRTKRISWKWYQKKKYCSASDLRLTGSRVSW